MILLYICVTWSWRIYDCSIYVLINRVWHILVEYKLWTHTYLLHSSILFGISSTAAQYQATWRTTSADLMISRRLSPSRRPCGALFFMYSFYDSALLELILDSDVIKDSFTIYTPLFRDMLMILFYICVTWSWRIYDCSVYVLVNRVWQNWYKSHVDCRTNSR
jgi:hypothetical protein